MKTKEWFEMWLSIYVAGQVKPRTYTKYSQIARTHITPYIGERELQSITREDIQRLVYGETMQKGLSASTVNSIITVLKCACDTAEEEDKLTHNPCRKLKRLPLVEQKVDAFTQAEQRKLEAYITQAGKPKLYGVLICLYMGLRIGELLALSWDDVDLKHRVVYIHQTIDEQGHRTSPKTLSAYRHIPIAPNLMSVFKRLYADKTCEYVIATNGHHTGIRAYQGLFRRALQKIGLRTLRFHALRHTFATRAIESGMDFKTLSSLMGHSSIAITMDRYAHCQMTHKRKALNRLTRMNNGE